MIVVSISSVPQSLRGDLTRWMFEIDTGVFVGRMSARVRDELWDRIIRECRNGRAVMVFGNDSEQRFDFRTNNSYWIPEDLDGIRIMRRPLSEGMTFSESRTGFSKASKLRKAKRFSIRESSGNVVFVSMNTQKEESGTTDMEYAVYNSSGVKLTGSNLANNASPDKEKAFFLRMASDIDGIRVVTENSEAGRQLLQLFSLNDINASGTNLFSLKSLAKTELPECSKHDLRSLCDHYGFDLQSVSRSDVMSAVYFKIKGTKTRF